MRIKIQGDIVEKTNLEKWNYTHGIYSMIMNHLPHKTAEKFHKKHKFIRLLTFSDIYFTPLYSNQGTIHFYVAGEDSLIYEFVEAVSKSILVRIEDMVVAIRKIIPLSSLTKKEKYLFKSKVIINISRNGKTLLLDDIPEVEERLRKNAIHKANLLGKDGDIKFQLINPVKNVEQYKNGHIFSWKCKLEVQGDYDVVSTIYEVGCGENTATGHGFLFEVL
ncbi:CRISPR-associated endoribonuclease Cas6 [Anoxybacteroides tepidamans]|uniref:CRISPR-associated endoribonuclease Cas6 n=1 Tax=Anoxybacteroides tepidamans TaxID=265948 RepID=UPI0004866614|nr:CRISPR-associated endoribonuclease Cas6 [Anoxybacillus tepidamans]